jgi:hypothetical protein
VGGPETREESGQTDSPLSENRAHQDLARRIGHSV